MSKSFEIININNTNLTVDTRLIKKEQMHFNATQIAKRYNTKPSAWLKSDRAKEYIDAFSEVDKCRLQDLVKVKHGGKHAGTWLHKSLALEFARFLDARFAVLLDKWIVQRLQKEKDWQLERQKLRTGYAPMTKAVEEAHENPQPYHFSNEANLINRILLGCTAKVYREKHCIKDVRNNLSVPQVEILESLQRANATLIEFNMPYEERKEKLKELYFKKLQQYQIEYQPTPLQLSI